MSARHHYGPHGPHIYLKLWRAMYRVTRQELEGDPRWIPLTTRQKSEWIVRQLCASCRSFINTPAFWLYFRQHDNVSGDDRYPDCAVGEFNLFSILAYTTPDEVVAWMDELFPDDPCYSTRLDPDHTDPSATIHIGGIPPPG
jgi:hypothetical protein